MNISLLVARLGANAKISDHSGGEDELPVDRSESIFYNNPEA